MGAMRPGSLCLLTSIFLSAGPTAIASDPSRSHAREEVIRSLETNQALFGSVRFDAFGGASQLLGLSLSRLEESRISYRRSGAQGYAGIAAQLLIPLRGVNGLGSGILYGTGKFATLPGAISGEAGLGLGKDGNALFPVATFALFPLQLYYSELGLVAHLPLFHETPSWMANFQATLRIHLPLERRDLKRTLTLQNSEGRIREVLLQDGLPAQRIQDKALPDHE